MRQIVQSENIRTRRANARKDPCPSHCYRGVVTSTPASWIRSERSRFPCAVDLRITAAIIFATPALERFQILLECLSNPRAVFRCSLVRYRCRRRGCIRMRRAVRRSRRILGNELERRSRRWRRDRLLWDRKRTAFVRFTSIRFRSALILNFGFVKIVKIFQHQNCNFNTLKYKAYIIYDINCKF